MSFGNPLDKSKVLPLVEGTGWNEMLELNRMAFDPALPKNSESRAISIAIMLLRKNAPHIKWILSYADGTQCGDGAIYRASGFYLTMIKENSDIFKLPDGKIIHSFNFKAASGSEKKKMMKLGYTNMLTYLNEIYPGWQKLKGFQLRYIFLMDPALKSKMKCSIIPFKEIDVRGAGMYRGKNISLQDRKPIHQINAPVA